MARTTIADGTPRMPALSLWPHPGADRFNHSGTLKKLKGPSDESEESEESACLGAVIVALGIRPGLVGHAQTTPGPTLTGMVRSASGEPMEGVTVSARVAGSSVTTSVFTDADGECILSPLRTARYQFGPGGGLRSRADRALSRQNDRALDVSLKTRKDFDSELRRTAGSPRCPKTLPRTGG